MKSYVVMEVTYEYDDSTYNQSEGGGTPLKVFSNKTKAQQFADSSNIKALRGLNLSNYTSDGWYGLVKGEEERYEVLKWFQVYSKDFPESDDEETITDDMNSDTPWDYELTVPDNVSDEDLIILYNNLCLEFFTVVEVEAEK